MIESLFIPLIVPSVLTKRAYPNPISYYSVTNINYHLKFLKTKEEFLQTSEAFTQEVTLQGSGGSNFFYSLPTCDYASHDLSTYKNSLGQSVSSTVYFISNYDYMREYSLTLYAKDRLSPASVSVKGNLKAIGFKDGRITFSPFFCSPFVPMEETRPFENAETQLLVLEWANHIATHGETKKILLGNTKRES